MLGRCFTNSLIPAVFADSSGIPLYIIHLKVKLFFQIFQILSCFKQLARQFNYFLPSQAKTHSKSSG